ncbi:MAG: hypothetical protein C3F02_03370 [Parcubacteria group bacterium]|nr:MAG: hypothetical protein C3F02_03370 [Parcubacteria group bacterium]
MPVYRYRAKNNEGQVTTGAVEAISENEVAELLGNRGLIILSLTQTKSKTGRGFNINIGRISGKDIVVFSRQFSVMISATVPVVQALRILVQQTANPLFAEKITEMVNDVDGGMKLSDSMAKHKKVFSRFYISMIKSGETSGRLEEVLEYLADQMEKDYDLVAKIKSAMIYPVFVIIGMIVVAFLMMVFVIPQMTQIIKESGAELPFLTKLLIGASDFMKNNYGYVLVGLVAALVIFRLWSRSRAGNVVWDTMKIQIPLFGPLFKKIYIVRFARSLSTLIKGGVPITTALRITSEVVDNKAYSKLIMDTVAEVEDGNSISSLFINSKLMPKMLSQMINIGERTGRVDTVLEKLSEFYSREIENLVQGMTSLIEPLILVIMGVGVGGMVAAIMLPMFKLAQAIK